MTNSMTKAVKTLILKQFKSYSTGLINHYTPSFVFELGVSESHEICGHAANFKINSFAGEIILTGKERLAKNL